MNFKETSVFLESQKNKKNVFLLLLLDFCNKYIQTLRYNCNEFSSIGLLKAKKIGC